MTKPQIWVSVFLALFILLFILQRAVSDKDSMTERSGMNNVPQSEDMSSAEVTPQQLMLKLGCTNCHGGDLKGTRLAPNLHGVGQFWSRDKLINYLRNPMAFMDSDRFKEYKQQYPGSIMPGFGNIDIKDLGRIADYLLTLQ
ncbi:MAG: cytochrome c [Ignavibacteriales bacterium]|nr:MAG: cytochrome c [Ignavibacteriales bacterium]